MWAIKPFSVKMDIIHVFSEPKTNNCWKIDYEIEDYAYNITSIINI